MQPYHLWMTQRSPFARRVRIALHRLGIPFKPMEINVFEPTEEFLKANPLGLVPVLLLPDGSPLSDSASILEHLHEAHGRRIWPEDPKLRLKVRSASTWAEGIMMSTVQHFLERSREYPSTEWLKEHEETIHRTLAQYPPWVTDASTQAGWDLGIALEYLDLRLPSLDWRDRYPRHLALLGDCHGHSEFSETTPPGMG